MRFSLAYQDASLNDEIAALKEDTDCLSALKLLISPESFAGLKGWMGKASFSAPVMDEIHSISDRIRSDGDLFVLVGVGGSNQAAQAAIDALGDGFRHNVRYAGNGLSPRALSRLLEELDGRNEIYINVIAKNFATLEPGSHFRVLRSYLEKRYGKADAGRRIIATGTIGSSLERISMENGYTFLAFPEDIGGRYSAHSAVGLLPMDVAGIDVDRLVEGVSDQMDEEVRHGIDSAAASYAIARRLLYEKGFCIEQLVSEEPALRLFGRWWRQMYGESGGKDGLGIYPATSIYTEDLHSIGQLVQEGARNLFETFLSMPDDSSLIVPASSYADGFEYIEGKDLAEMNRIAIDATIGAHSSAGVPCIRLDADGCDAYSWGRVFYFFEFSCALSCLLFGVNPFDQNGVEEYKRRMFKALGQNGV